MSWTRYLALWSGVVVLFALQWFVQDSLQGRTWSMGDYLRWSAVEWYTWAALAPLVFQVTRRHPIESLLDWRALRAHATAGAGITLLAIVIGATVSHLLEPGSLGEQLGQFFGKHVALGLLTYGALVAIGQAMNFQREKTRRELEASRLAAELAESRLLVLKAQLQPHFLFNTLHAIVTLLDQDPAAAEDMLLRLSELLRAFLDDHEGQEISLARELELLELYLGIQRTRFKDRLTTQVYVAPDALDGAVPSLILQPLVENAIRHGIGKHIGADTIEIDCRRDGDALTLEVRNRNSLLDSGASAPQRRGIGLANTQLRLRELYGERAEIRLDAMWPKGAACRVRLPFRALGATGTPLRREVA